MRTSNLFAAKLLRNKRIKIDKVQEVELRKTNADFWFTTDTINGRQRRETVLSNGYSVGDYEIIDELKPLVFPSEITILPGVRYEDYLNREYKLYEADPELKEGDADYSPKLLKPEEYKEALIYLVSVMKVTLKSESFKAISTDEATLASGKFYQVDGYTDSTVDVSVFPIPVKVQVLTKRNNLMAVDEDYISEWLTNNVFSKLLTKS